MAQHDPGGKTRIALAEGMSADAWLSECGRYRHALMRDWTPPGQSLRCILWIGLNPSTADARVNDPTCLRELGFSRDWGFTRYLKGNLLDWRATSPRDLPHDPALARSADNLPSVLSMAAEAELVVLAHGNFHQRYRPLHDEMLARLRGIGKPLRCLGRNASGAAKHPLYLRKDAVLITYD